MERAGCDAMGAVGRRETPMAAWRAHSPSIPRREGVQREHLPRQEVVVRGVDLRGRRRGAGATRVAEVEGRDESVAIAQRNVIVSNRAQGATTECWAGVWWVGG